MSEYKLNMIVGIMVVLLPLFTGIYLLRKFSQKVGVFINDTLKERQSNGYWKWSKNSIIIATAWAAVLFVFIYDEIINGFNETAWMYLAGVAIGSPIASAYAKKLNPLVQPPKDEQL